MDRKLKINEQPSKRQTVGISKKWQKLKQKYDTDKQFRQKIDQRTIKYQQLLDNSILLEQNMVNEDLFVCYNQSTFPIYFYFGILHDINNEKKGNNLLYFIKFFNRNPTQDYYFIFLNNNASYKALTQFKQIFLQLKKQHFFHLKEFIVIKPNSFQFAQDLISFDLPIFQNYKSNSNVFSSYLNSLTKYLGSINQLCTYLGIEAENFIDIFPQELAKIQFPEMQRKKFNLENQRINFYGQLLNDKERQQRNQFEKDIKSFLLVKPGQQTHLIEDYEANEMGIPIVLAILIYYFKKNPEGLKLQGLFRKSVSIQQQSQTFSELSNKNYEFLLKIQNPHLIANLIKRFFNNLKIPIFPYKQFEQLMHDQGISDKKQLVKQIVHTLKQINYLCLMFLIQFLKDQVVTNVQFNKMTELNLSICFAPCLLRAEKASTADLIFASKCAVVVRIMLENLQMIFGNTEQRKNRYQMISQKHTREFQVQIHSAIIKKSKTIHNSNCLEKYKNDDIDDPSNYHHTFQEYKRQNINKGCQENQQYPFHRQSINFYHKSYQPGNFPFIIQPQIGIQGTPKLQAEENGIFKTNMNKRQTVEFHNRFQN